jgi:hypothetical protein
MDLKKLDGLWQMIGGVVLLTCLAAPTTAHAAEDVGLYTAVKGKTTYESAGAKDKSAGLEAMMKARAGDRVALEKGATVRLVYFASGKQEAWQGPVVFVVGEDGSKTEGETKPTVLQIPKMAARRLDSLPGPMPGTPVRSWDTKKKRPVKLASWEQEEIDAAQAEYKKMRKQTTDDDITPELYLVTVLSDYDLHSEIKKIVGEAEKRSPGHPAVKKIDEWLKGTEKK